MLRPNCRELCLYCNENIYYYVNYSKFHGLCYQHGIQSHEGQKLFCSHCKTFVYVLSYSVLCSACKGTDLKQHPCGCYYCPSTKVQLSSCDQCKNIIIANDSKDESGYSGHTTATIHDNKSINGLNIVEVENQDKGKKKPKKVQVTESDDSEDDNDWLDDLMDFLTENFGCGCKTTESTLKPKNG